MGHTVNSITINALYKKVFTISNDITRWTELFGKEYIKTEVLSTIGNRISFRLTDDEGKSWESFRLLYPDDKFAYAERFKPKFPFIYMKTVWLYTPMEDGILMTWIQDFKMDPKARFNDQQVEGFINEHAKHNMKIFKKVIEADENVYN